MIQPRSLLPGLTEAIIRQNAGSTVFSRGEAYARQNVVIALVLRGNTLTAAVQGSEYEPYRVLMRFDNSGLTKANCTCSFEGGDWCKHVVATLLIALRQPDQIAQRPPLATQLAPLDRTQLVALLERIASEDPAVVDRIEHHLILDRARVTSTSTPVSQRPIDAAPVQARMRQLFNPRGNGSNYGHDQTILNEVAKLLAQIAGFVESDDGTNALRLLDALTSEYMQNWFEYDDEGELGTLLNEIGEMWAEALLTADMPPDVLQEWAERLEEWANEADDYGAGDGLRLAAAAAAQGWTDPSIQAALAGEVSNSAHAAVTGSIAVADDEDDEWDEQDEEEEERPTLLSPDAVPYASSARTLIQIRLRILDRQRRDDEYLNVATATGEHALRVAKLAQLGRTDEATASSLRDLTLAQEALAVAQALRQQGALDAALRVAEFGLTLGGPVVELGEWLVGLASTQGHHDLALQAARITFEAAPTLARYEQLHAMAGESGWPLLRTALLDHLRETGDSWQHASARIDIFLSENLIDDAITVADPRSYEADLARVADAAITQRPEWVIRSGRKRAGAIIEAGKATAYDIAAAWLRRVRDASHAAGRSAEWSSYIGELRANHGRKYKLMSLINNL